MPNALLHQSQFTVNPAEDGVRLDVFLSKKCADLGLSREKIKALITVGEVSVDGTVCTKPRHKVQANSQVAISFAPVATNIVPEYGEVEILYADEHLLVVNKPAGLTVHPAPDKKEGTLVHFLTWHYPALLAMEGERPGIVHRIDKDTSGLLVVALTENVRLALSRDFASRNIDKEYLALVHGVPHSENGIITASIGRDPRHKTKMAVAAKGGRSAKTMWQCLWSSPDKSISLVQAKIFTGRTHQIRVHMASIGHALLFDSTYGPREHAQWLQAGKKLPPVPRQMLHAHKLGFTHPVTGKQMQFCLPPPQDFQSLCLDLCSTTLRVGLVGLAGSGKSTVGKLLSQNKDIPLFIADEAVKKQYLYGADGWIFLRSRFGRKIAPDNRPVDKKALSRLMDCPQLKREVEGLIHPLIVHALDIFWKEHDRKSLAVAELPLFFESGWQKGNKMDFIVGVQADTEKRNTRLAKRGLCPENIARLNSWHWPEADKMALCDVVIKNNATYEALQKQVTELKHTLNKYIQKQHKERWARLKALWSAQEA